LLKKKIKNVLTTFNDVLEDAKSKKNILILFLPMLNQKDY